MAKFELDGISLRIPGKVMSPALEEALRSGRYEHAECGALKRHLQPGDRVLDLGAGAGYVSAQAARIVGGANVVSVEASADMIEVLQRNLRQNGAKEATVVHGAVVDAGYQGDTVEFAVRPAFWASSIAEDHVPDDIRQSMPALRFADLVAMHEPTVLVMDVEGAEVALAQEVWPDHVRLAVMEIHTNRYPPRDVQRIFDGLSKSGMTYMPWGSRGEVLVFQRVVEE